MTLESFLIVEEVINTIKTIYEIGENKQTISQLPFLF
jgi:hypothetical protein